MPTIDTNTITIFAVAFSLVMVFEARTRFWLRWSGIASFVGVIFGLSAWLFVTVLALVWRHLGGPFERWCDEIIDDARFDERSE